jgi:phosphoglycolate phosphatase
MRDQVWDLMKHFGVKEEWIRERYLLEIIDEIYFLLWERNPSKAVEFYQRAHQILHEIELKAAEEGRLVPGAEETLKILREKGIKVGIVTRNCEDAVRKVFPQIDQYCDIFVSRNSIKKVKPHPDQLTHVIESLKVSEKEAVMVGDHSIDIQAGKGVGMKTIGVLTGRTKRGEFEIAGADYILKDVSEVHSLLEGE